MTRDYDSKNPLKSNCHLLDFLSTAEFFVDAKDIGQSL